jgi:hypothetical protein
MKSHRLARITLFLALTLVGAGIAHAEDFTLTVPVHLSNLMPSINSGRIECLVTNGNTYQSESRIGQGTTQFTIESATGRFDQNVVVRFNAAAGKDPAMATHYWCAFHIMSANPLGDFSFGWGTSFASGWTAPGAFTTKPGAPFVPWVSGLLP